jgi:hypothetical protein
LSARLKVGSAAPAAASARRSTVAAAFRSVVVHYEDAGYWKGLLGLDARRRTEAVGTAHGRRAVKGRRARRRAAAGASHVRRDVGRAALAVAAVLLLAWLGSVLRLLQTEVVHVELVGHDCDDFAGRECKSVG